MSILKNREFSCVKKKKRLPPMLCIVLFEYALGFTTVITMSEYVRRLKAAAIFDSTLIISKKKRKRNL